MPKTSASSCRSQQPLGVPRNSGMCSAKRRQIRRESVSTGVPSSDGTPSASSGTPCE